MNKQYILGIETSVSPASVALVKEEQLIAEKEIDSQGKTSSLISKIIEDVLRSNNVSPKEIKAVAIGMGPGSFTGLRVGMATAKGLAFGLGVPIQPVDSLKALALNFQNREQLKNKIVISMFNARKGKVFAGVYQNEQTLNKPSRYYINELCEEYSDDVIYICPDIDEISTYFPTEKFPLKAVKISAYNVVLQAEKTKTRMDPQDLAYLEPNYLINNYIQ